MKKFQIAVIGSAGAEEYPENSLCFSFLEKLSYEIGKLLAEADCYVITGGKSGIMQAVAKGCREAGGVNIGVVKGEKRGTSNKFVDIEIVTNMGDGGDAFLIPYSADGAIIIGGGVGTLKEIAGFYLQGKPLVALKGSGGWAEKLAETYIDERNITKVVLKNSPQDAVEYIISVLEKTSSLKFISI